jgi:hypothetical protein
VVGGSHLERFTRSLEAVNAFTADRAVRAYQREIIETGSFSIIAPFSGEPVKPDSCHIVNNGDPAHGNLGIAYRLPGRDAVWLLAGSVKDGFPINEVFSARTGASLWALAGEYSQLNRAWKQQLENIESAKDDVGIVTADLSAPCVLAGHPNFAHHLWNELAGLYSYMQQDGRLPVPLRIACLYQPLLPLRYLFDQQQLQVERLDRFEKLLGFQQRMVTRLGSTRIPLGLRQLVSRKLLDYSDKTILAPLEKALQIARPIVWLSVRLDARTLDNQTEFLTDLMAGIVAEYPLAGFVLDGFSFPDDFGSPLYADGGAYLANAMLHRERELQEYINKLLARCALQFNNPVVSVSGMRLAEAVRLARLADYYVCHAGTIQHKIAWFHNTPGMVHSNSAGLQPGASKWLADQVQDGRPPRLLSPQLVSDLDSIRSINQVPRNRDYHITDIPNAVVEILNDLNIVIGAGHAL